MPPVLIPSSRQPLAELKERWQPDSAASPAPCASAPGQPRAWGFGVLGTPPWGAAWASCFGIRSQEQELEGS